MIRIESFLSSSWVLPVPTEQPRGEQHPTDAISLPGRRT